MCLDIYGLLWPDYIFLGSTYFLLLTFVVSSYLLLRNKKITIFLLGVAMNAVFHLSVLFIVLVVLVIFAPSKNLFYDTVNAAIKNTCIVDPLQRNCPKSVEGILALDENFAGILAGKDVNYSYDPLENTYNLKIFDKKARTVQIFDPKLAANGYSYFDNEVRRIFVCNGAYVVGDVVFGGVPVQP